jgi:predicted glycosyltransferase involved in capsule biosynthesis
MKHDLSKATFIVPIRIESEDRMRNVITSILFLLENFDTTVIVKEVDTTSVFEQDVLPQIKECSTSVENLIHIFEQSDDPVFYRMRILNEMLNMTKNDIVVNCDCDIVLPIQSYLDAYNLILSGEADVVYPYGNGNYQKQVFANDELVSEFLSNECDFSILESKSNISTSDFGWIQFFNRKVYIEGGMENENFRGSSPEDKERFYRFTTLGYNVNRLDSFIYHLEHSRGRNSWPTSIQGNPYMQQNFELWNRIQTMNKEELLNYYSKQEYLKKYDNRVLSS